MNGFLLRPSVGTCTPRITYTDAFGNVPIGIGRKENLVGDPWVIWITFVMVADAFFLAVQVNAMRMVCVFL